MSKPPQDDRIPLRFGTPDQLRPREALLIDCDIAAPPGVVVKRFQAETPFHRIGCTCCAPRRAAATALGQLLHARARGDVAWFTGVLAVVADPATQAAAVAADVLTASRFRIVS